VAAYFDYTLATDIINCADGIKNAGNNDFLKAGAIIACIGDAISAIAKGLADEIAALLNGQFTLPLIGWILPKAELGLKTSSDVTADFNLQVAIEIAKDLSCSFPGGFEECLDAVLGKKLAGADESNGGPGNFAFKVCLEAPTTKSFVLKFIPDW
jgi:hypothetical protein